MESQPTVWGIAVVFYRPGRQRLVVVRRCDSSISETVARVVEAVRRHERCGDFLPITVSDVKLQVDVIENEPQAIAFTSLRDHGLDSHRFDYGVDGLRIVARGKTHYFLPGDAFVKSVLGMAQLQRTIERMCPGEDLARLPMARFRSQSFLRVNDDLSEKTPPSLPRGFNGLCTSSKSIASSTCAKAVKPPAQGRERSIVNNVNNRWIKLFRGIPVLSEQVTADDLWSRAEAAVARVIRTQSRDGKFEYYYDAKTDSYVNHEHPQNDPVKNPFYNFVRHCGGLLTLLFFETARRDPRVAWLVGRDSGSCDLDLHLDAGSCLRGLSDDPGQMAGGSGWNPNLRGAVEAGVDCYLQTLTRYIAPEGRAAAFAVDNQKGKLGGSGLGLYAICLYQHLFDDARYSPTAHELANHLVEEIQASGEFRYYHTYLSRPVTLEENSQLFSFYYPGEAIVGLAAYLKYVLAEGATADYARITERLHRALRFLIVERPRKYAAHFASLPSDSWLMMGIQELWDFAEFQKSEYQEFVFGDADAMCNHQYTPKNALHPGDIGSFYYQYGDHPYPDGARAEGLTAAFKLAIQVGDEARQRRYFKSLARVAWACLHLCNTRESLYSVPNPEHALGSIRFKFTRQWVRIDTTEHVVSFFVRFLPYLITEASQKTAAH